MIVVFAITIFVMMVLGGAGFSQLNLYVVIGLTILVPYLLWMRLLVRFDPWTPRARKLVFLAILWGCIPAVLASVFMEAELDGVVTELGEASLGLMVVAPFSEELAKGLFVVLCYIFGRRHLRGPWDGLFMGALVGAGFGFAEDIGYLASAFSDGGVISLIVNYVLREVFTAHAHLVFTACTGLAAGLAARHGLPMGHGLGWIGLGFLAAFALHAVWDTSTAVLPSGDTAIMLFEPIIQGSVYAAIAIAGLRVLRRREDRMLTARLAEYAEAGWFSAEEIASVADPKARRAAVKRTRRMPALRRQAVRFLFAVQTLLALNRQKALMAQNQFDHTEKEDVRLRNLVVSARAMGTD
ncbi:PrsW family intramembrane metalloprotease [Pelagibacterium sp. H642]|uniref:PrsW family intramembrane metalloprotease n=1 Tax=Pelagibacterium sp. H642 TaxID=1881069 RepID=UPI0028167354|nr:PrsW family intramembrane metalloprotease [Pelagibacterium sp. H642]WMT91965.1 PrsW family intramembrane metalloprotease [Pelagibacterium sp. H642]